MKKIFVLIFVVLIVVGVVFFLSNNAKIKQRESEKNLPIQTENIKKQENFIEKIFKKKEPTVLLFVGDMMFDRGVRFNSNKISYEKMLEGVSSLFEKNDLIVGNLEGTVTNNQSISISNSQILRFTFDPKVLLVLKKNNFGLFSLANNHSTDFYIDGLNQTKNDITENGMLHFGSAKNSEDISKKIQLNNKTFCFFSYHDLYVQNENVVVEEINKLKNECDKSIVYAHWGEEYKTKPNFRQAELAHMFIDSGADLVIGTHPHVVQSVEKYKNKAIFYSLGNFIFDQSFSFETMHTIAIKAYFMEQKIIFEIIPIKIDKGVLSYVDSNTAEKILNPISTEFKSKNGQEHESKGFILENN